MVAAPKLAGDLMPVAWDREILLSDGGKHSPVGRVTRCVCGEEIIDFVHFVKTLIASADLADGGCFRVTARISVLEYLKKSR